MDVVIPDGIRDSLHGVACLAEQSPCLGQAQLSQKADKADAALPLKNHAEVGGTQMHVPGDLGQREIAPVVPLDVIHRLSDGSGSASPRGRRGTEQGIQQPAHDPAQIVIRAGDDLASRAQHRRIRAFRRNPSLNRRLCKIECLAKCVPARVRPALTAPSARLLVDSGRQGARAFVLSPTQRVEEPLPWGS